MGYLLHGRNDYEFEDRLLAHLKTVIGQKLVKQESFFLSWTKTPEQGSGRISLWFSPYVNVAFKFGGSKSPELNLVWLKALNALSNTPRGLLAITEEEAERYARKNPDLL